MGRLFLVAVFATVASAGPILVSRTRGTRKPQASSGRTGLDSEMSARPPKKNPECIPPGQCKKLFEVGQRVPKGYEGLRPYRSLPYELRSGTGGALDPHASYIYDENFLYRVDPATSVVRQILRSLI